MYYFVPNQCVSRDSQDGFSYICTTQTFVSAADIFEEDYKKSFILSKFCVGVGGGAFEKENRWKRLCIRVGLMQEGSDNEAPTQRIHLYPPHPHQAPHNHPWIRTTTFRLFEMPILTTCVTFALSEQLQSTCFSCLRFV